MKMTNRSNRRVCLRLRVGPLLACGALLANGACDAGQQEPPGAPVLQQMFWRALDGRQLVWSSKEDARLTSPVSPTPLEFDLIFDRRLDGEKIEETFVQNGVTLTRPRADPPITVSWPQMAPGDAPFVLAVAYNSLPLTGQPRASTYVFGRSLLGYPSATTLTFHLDRDRLTNAAGQAMVGPDSITVATAAFAVQIRKPRSAGEASPAIIASDYQIPLTFNNLPADEATVHPFVALTIDEVASDFRLQADGKDASTLYLTPASAGQSWPAGARVGVRVTPGLPDRFGVPLEVAAETVFLVAGGDDGGGDDGGDGGAPDGGTDGGADDLATDGGADDLATDGGADDLATDGGADDLATDGGADGSVDTP